MIYVLWVALILLTVLVQGSVSFFHIKLNLTVILVCYIGMKRGEIPGMFFGALIGLIEDILSGVLLGPNIHKEGLDQKIVEKLNIWTPLIGAINIFSLTFLDRSIVFILRSIFDKIPVDIGTALFIIMVQSLVNAPLGIFIKPKDMS